MSTEIVGPEYTGSFSEQEEKVNSKVRNPSVRQKRVFVVFFMEIFVSF
jgi:hypothetical protein